MTTLLASPSIAPATFSLRSVLEESGITPHNPIPPTRINSPTKHLRSRAQKLKSQKLRFIHSDCFDDPNAAEAILGPLPEKEPDNVKPMKVLPMPEVCPPVGLQNYLSQLYSIRSLADNQERHLARKVNYLKYRAFNLREGLSVRIPDPELVNAIESLLSEASEYRSQLAQSKLILVTWFAKRAYLSDEERNIDNLEDYVQLGNIALIRAAGYFNFKKHRAFIAYAAASIRNEIRWYRLKQHKIPTATAVEDDTLDYDTLDYREDPHERDMHARDNGEYADKLLSRVNERGQKLIRWRFGIDEDDPLSLQAMGDREGITKQGAKAAYVRAMDQLQESLSTGEPPSKKPWRPIGSVRPDEFTFGPLTGPLTRIAVAVFGGCPQWAYPKLESSCRRFEIWIAKVSETAKGFRGAKGLFEVWFRSEPDFSAASGRFTC
jgi:RNA polymerase sigma factor (sigma-70 family)